MYTFCVVMIAIASILLILAVLVQSPKSGMAANFGAANQTIGVRQTTDILEKFTWAMIVAIVVFSLLSTTALPKSETVAEQHSVAGRSYNESKAATQQTTADPLEVGSENALPAAEEAAAAAAEEVAEQAQTVVEE